jgi:hypothetical protein
MPIICLLTLAIVNGAYLVAAYNMDWFIEPISAEEQASQTELPEEEIVTSVAVMDFASIFELDIFDFDVAELEAEGNDGASNRSTRRTKDEAKGKLA